MAVASILAVADSSGPGAVHDPFRSDAVYQVTDDEPFILVALPRKVKLRCQDDKTPPRKLTGPAHPLGVDVQWWRVPVVSTPRLTDERPLGYHELCLVQPSAVIRYYLWPARLFDRHQWVTMMEDIEAETGIRPWSTGSEARVAVEDAPRVASPSVEAYIDLIEAEARAVAHLMLHPYDEVWMSEELIAGLPDLPENRLILRWFARRQPLVHRVVRRLQSSIGELRTQQKQAQGNKGQLDRLAERIEAQAQLQARARALQTRFARWRGRLGAARDDGGLIISPAMLRDHRLRRLLSALKITADERLQETLGRRSNLPPMKTPAFFELWGAVWLAGCLRRLGWQGPPPRCWGADREMSVDGIYRARWTLHKDAFELTLDWEISPVIARPGSVSARARPALEAAAERLVERGERGVVYATRPNTPDYLVRLRGPSGRAFAIGDASLADPKHQKGDKIDKISRYPREVAWLPDEADALVACAPLGLFLLLPGPLSAWHRLDDTAAACDCRLFAPSPGAPSVPGDPEVDDWIAHLMKMAGGGR